MPRHDTTRFERHVAAPGWPVVTASPCARSTLQLLRRTRGRQVVVLGSTCARLCVAHVRTESGYTPRDGEVRIGTVAHCPVYARPDSLETCPHDGLVLDLHSPAGRHDAPLFVTRPESRAERQQRVFNGRA